MRSWLPGAAELFKIPCHLLLGILFPALSAPIDSNGCLFGLVGNLVSGTPQMVHYSIELSPLLVTDLADLVKTGFRGREQLGCCHLSIWLQFYQGGFLCTLAKTVSS
jgi:hypothetical protein